MNLGAYISAHAHAATLASDHAAPAVTLRLEQSIRKAGQTRILAEMRSAGSNGARAADLAELLAALGARISEVTGDKRKPGLRWRDVDWGRCQVTLYTGKGRISEREIKTRIIPLHPRLAACLARLRDTGKEKSPNDLVVDCKVARRSLQGACKRLKEEGKLQCDRLSHHDLRHLFTSWCLEAGIDIVTLAVYSHLRTEHLHAKVKKLSALQTPQAA